MLLFLLNFAKLRLLSWDEYLISVDKSLNSPYIFSWICFISSFLLQNNTMYWNIALKVFWFQFIMFHEILNGALKDNPWKIQEYIAQYSAILFSRERGFCRRTRWRVEGVSCLLEDYQKKPLKETWKTCFTYMESFLDVISNTVSFKTVLKHETSFTFVFFLWRLLSLQSDANFALLRSNLPKITICAPLNANFVLIL